MANKRNRQKQMNSSKTLEGYEKRLLKEIRKWEDVISNPRTADIQRDAMNRADLLRVIHMDIRKYYFDL
ncbi:hypothetical protein H7992_21905 [Sporosarcina sp. resist]|uniref:hypothetical protein n=1 Tax=Sporosarcina sp. resist TaxID=2762563 RepID=UPI00164DC0BE|nr:hypothetical protein [Sporosarcina sp. resist]QNK87788.1 hypothetical protein H7992_21905 [Sporosarcina sp. resist]